MGVLGIVFDLDGTLLNSLDDLANAANTVLRSHEFPAHPTDAYRFFVGDGVRCLMQRIVPAACRDDPERLTQWVDEFLQLYRSAWNVQSELYDGITDLLHELTRRSVPLAVLSNKPQESTARCVEYFLPEFSFVAVYGQQPGRAPKPDLTGVLEIIDRLGVVADQCMFVGDTAVDMNTAVGAGMIPVGVAWGFRGVDELRASGARHIIHHPRELLERIDA